jgi:hypothetical protein
VRGDAERLLARLNNGATDIEITELGDSMLLPAAYEEVTDADLVRLFGSGFDEELAALPTGRWSGPVGSGYGLHLVRIQRRTAGRDPALDEVRRAVEREWRSARDRQAGEDFYRALRERYAIVIEQPSAEDEVARVVELER